MDGFGVAGEAFGFGEQHRFRSEGAERFLIVLLHGDELDEVVDAQAAAHARGAAGGQSVIGAGDVIAHGLRGPAADENGTGVLDPIKIDGGVNGEVFGRETVGDGAGFFDCCGDDDEAVAVDGLTGYGVVAAAESCFGDNFFGEVGAGGDEDGERFRIVLGLRYEVAGNVRRGSLLAGYDNLGRAGEHVDGAVEGDESLGSGDIEVARTDDFVDPRNARGPVCERGNRMRAAQAIPRF